MILIFSLSFQIDVHLYKSQCPYRKRKPAWIRPSLLFASIPGSNHVGSSWGSHRRNDCIRKRGSNKAWEVNECEWFPLESNLDWPLYKAHVNKLAANGVHRSFDFPKLHAQTHVFDDIEQKGVLRNYSTRLFERLHGPLKLWYQRRTNFKDVAHRVSQFWSYHLNPTTALLDPPKRTLLACIFHYPKSHWCLRGNKWGWWRWCWCWGRSSYFSKYIYIRQCVSWCHPATMLHQWGRTCTCRWSGFPSVSKSLWKVTQGDPQPRWQPCTSSNCSGTISNGWWICKLLTSFLTICQLIDVLDTGASVPEDIICISSWLAGPYWSATVQSFILEGQGTIWLCLHSYRFSTLFCSTPFCFHLCRKGKRRHHNTQWSNRSFNSHSPCSTIHSNNNLAEKGQGSLPSSLAN